MVFHGCFEVTQRLEGYAVDSGILEFRSDSAALLSEVPSEMFELSTHEDVSSVLRQALQHRFKFAAYLEDTRLAMFFRTDEVQHFVSARDLIVEDNLNLPDY